MKKMKAIVSIILVIVMFCLMGTGCSKENTLQFKKVENYPVKVSQLDLKIFENRIPSTVYQQQLQEDIISILSDKSISDIPDFVVNYSPAEESLTSWAECNDYAQNFDPNHNSKLGSVQQYYLFLAQRIQNGEKWEDICDKEVKKATLTFNINGFAIGTCTIKCLILAHTNSSKSESNVKEYHCAS